MVSLINLSPDLLLSELFPYLAPEDRYNVAILNKEIYRRLEQIIQQQPMEQDRQFIKNTHTIKNSAFAFKDIAEKYAKTKPHRAFLAVKSQLDLFWQNPIKAEFERIVSSASLTAENQISLPLPRPYALEILELAIDALNKYRSLEKVSESDMSKFNVTIELKIIPTLCFIAEKESEIAQCNRIYQLVIKAIALNTALTKNIKLEKILSESIGKRIENDPADADAKVLIPLSNSPSVKFIKNLCNRAQNQTDPIESYQTLVSANIEQQKIRDWHENQEALIEIIHTLSSMTRYYNSFNEKMKTQILEWIRTVTKDPKLINARDFSTDLAKAEAGFGDYQAALTLLQTASKEHPIKIQYVLEACEIAKFSIQEAYPFIKFALQNHTIFGNLPPCGFPLIMKAICDIAEAHRSEFPALINEILQLAFPYINALPEGKIKQKSLESFLEIRATVCHE